MRVNGSSLGALIALSRAGMIGDQAVTVDVLVPGVDHVMPIQDNTIKIQGRLHDFINSLLICLG